MRARRPSSTASQDALATLRAQHALPPDVEIVPVYDQASLVDDAMASVRDAILIGIALSLLVIAFALRDWRAGLVAALPVPLTLLGTFAVMRWLGVTLNLMSLGGLAVAIGLVVDDAIVVTEGIVRRLEEGLMRRQAIELGHARHVRRRWSARRSRPSSCSRRSRCSPGVTGSFLGALAITLAIAVLLSMIMSLTLIPVLATRLRHRKPNYVASETDRDRPLDPLARAPSHRRARGDRRARAGRRGGAFARSSRPASCRRWTRARS